MAACCLVVVAAREDLLGLLGRLAARLSLPALVERAQAVPQLLALSVERPPHVHGLAADVVDAAKAIERLRITRGGLIDQLIELLVGDLLGARGRRQREQGHQHHEQQRRARADH